MRREDVILYSLLLAIGVALPIALTAVNYSFYESRSLWLMQILSMMIYVPLAFFIATALTGDGKHLTEGRWDRFSGEKREAFKQLSVPMGRLLTAVLALGAVALEIVLFFLPSYSWAIVLVTVLLAIIASIAGIKRIVGKAKGSEGSSFSLLSSEDKMALMQISFASIFLLAIVLPVALFISGGIFGDFSVTMDDEKVTIDSPIRNWDIPYSDVETCELKDEAFVVRRESGLGNHEIIAGKLYNEEIGRCNGALYKSTGACVLIKTFEGTYYVFNDASVNGTAMLYEELLTHL